MALETGTYISDLVATNPPGSDGLAQADDHLRLLKSTIKATFPNISGAMTATHTVLNGLDGRVTTIEADYVKDTGDTLTGTWNASAATWSDLGAVTAVDLNGGTIDAMAIGGTTPAAGTFTVLSANGAATFNSTVALSADPTTALQAATKQYADAVYAATGFLTGLALSNNVTDADHDIDIAAGSCSDATKSVIMTASALTKRIDATWTVGTNQGGLDTGTVANSTWYHVWLIKRSDTGVVDALFSTSATSPTMPTNYTHKRRIGAVLTDGTANIISFKQHGDYFYWDQGISNYWSNNTGTSAVTVTLTVPTGVETQGLIVGRNAGTTDGSTIAVCFYSTDVADPTLTQQTAHTYNGPSSENDSFNIPVRADTSAQIKFKASISGTTRYVGVMTVGWIDPRSQL